MIENASYDEILKIAQELNNSAQIISSITTKNGITDLEDFVSTVEGYSKYLETTVSLYKDADVAVQELKNTKK